MKPYTFCMVAVHTKTPWAPPVAPAMALALAGPAAAPGDTGKSGYIKSDLDDLQDGISSQEDILQSGGNGVSKDDLQGGGNGMSNDDLQGSGDSGYAMSGLDDHQGGDGLDESEESSKESLDPPNDHTHGQFVVATGIFGLLLLETSQLFAFLFNSH